MANLDLAQDVANKRERTYAKKWPNRIPYQIAVRMRRYGSLIKINPFTFSYAKEHDGRKKRLTFISFFSSFRNFKGKFFCRAAADFGPSCDPPGTSHVVLKPVFFVFEVFFVFVTHGHKDTMREDNDYRYGRTRSVGQKTWKGGGREVAFICSPGCNNEKKNSEIFFWRQSREKTWDYYLSF